MPHDGVDRDRFVVTKHNLSRFGTVEGEVDYVRREISIERIKTSPEYLAWEHYVQEELKDGREPRFPRPPDPYDKTLSTRSFESLKRIWRRKLHMYSEWITSEIVEQSRERMTMFKSKEKELKLKADLERRRKMDAGKQSHSL